MQIKEILNQARKILTTPRKNAESEELLAFFLSKSRQWVVLNNNENVDDAEGYFELIKRREGGEPLEYLLGYAEFFGGKFLVNSNVLIPRPETEMLVERALKYKGGILEIGTGSGCISVSLALAGREVWACDISPAALNVARKNAKNLGADVNFFESDLWDKVEEFCPVVVANLPYVPLGHAQKTVEDFEPSLAVFSGEDGLDLYRRFFLEMPYVPEVVMLEMHFSQANEIIKMAKNKNPKWRAEVVQDLAGFDRCIILS